MHWKCTIIPLTQFNDCLNNGLVSLTRIHLRQSEKVALLLIRCKRKFRSTVTQLVPTGFYNVRLMQIFVLLAPVERWSFILWHHALNLLYFTLRPTRLVSDSKDFSRALVGFSSSSDRFPGLFTATYATDFFARFSPLACVLIGLLFCLDYATFSLSCYCDFHFLYVLIGF